MKTSRARRRWRYRDLVRWLSATVVALAAPLLFCGWPTGAEAARAMTPATPIPPLTAYGDSQAVLEKATLATALSGLPPCIHSVAKEPSFARALSDANNLFKGKAAAGKRRLDSRTYSGTAGRAEVFAAGASAAKAPAAGLAALLDARSRKPHDPMLLVNASVLLTELGHPGDALAFLDHARKLGKVTGAPLGLSNTAIEQNDRGFALLGLGKYPAALTALRAAVHDGAPLLSEASINEAQALNCTGQRTLAFGAIMASAYRQKYDLVEDGGDEPPTPETGYQAPPSQLGFTKPTVPPDTLPKLKYPTQLKQMRAALAGFENLQTYLSNQSLKLFNEVESQGLTLFKKLQHVSPITRQRTNEILALVDQTGPPEPALTKPWDAYNKAFNDESNFLEQFTGQAPPSPCGHQGQWMSLQQALDTAARNYVTAVGKYETPLIANLANPVAHDIAVEDVEAGDVVVLEAGLVDGVINWASIVLGGNHSQCSPTQASFPAPRDHVPDVGDPGDCPELLAAVKLHVDIADLVEIKVNCESVELEVADEGLVAPFGSIEHEFRTGETTIFGGVKVGAELGPLSGDLKEGFYVKGGADGIEDWGVRISTSASVSSGGVLVEYGSSVDISLAGSISYIPTAFGFR